jgi:hypothetical protein
MYWDFFYKSNYLVINLDDSANLGVFPISSNTLIMVFSNSGSQIGKKPIHKLIIIYEYLIKYPPFSPIRPFFSTLPLLGHHYLPFRSHHPQYPSSPLITLLLQRSPQLLVLLPCQRLTIRRPHRILQLLHRPHSHHRTGNRRIIQHPPDSYLSRIGF